MLARKIFLLFCLAVSFFQTIAQNTPNQAAYSNDWMAVDGAGRTLPTYAQVGAHNSGRYVGVFYWLWHAYIRNNPIRNMTQELRNTNGNPNFVAQDWYWAEPENGYYHNSDPWVIRRHLQMLANAGVDFVYIDFTNGTQGNESFDAFATVAQDMQNRGIPVPKFVFFINDEGGRTAMDWVYNNIYKLNKYQSLWFYWGGKPLIMEGAIHASSPEIANFFTFRDTWAFNQTQEDYWNFIDNYPQHYSTHNGVPEQIVVSKSMGAPLISTGAVNDKGSSYTSVTGTPAYSATWETARTPYGDYFEEQWSRAHQVNPQIVCVTGWNEWSAGQWQSSEPGLTFMGKPCSQIGWYMVDEFNVEFNRDMEPVKGEYTDNYYYQLIKHIRQYKGLNAPPATSAGKTISIDGNFAEWSNVTPLYKDASGDVQNRNFKNVNNSGTYVNNTGRNDIIESRVTSDANNVYFYTKTVDNLTAWNSTNWMFLFIDVDKNKSTGWEGYDYVINQGVNSASQTTVKKWINNAWSQVGTCSFNATGNQLEIAVPKSLLSVGSAANIQFHWADNMQTLNDLTQFFINGESAPDRRFNYEYNYTSGASQTPYAGIIQLPGTVEAENYDIGGEGVAFHDSDGTNASAALRSDGVDIEACSEGGYNLDWSNNGEWTEYTVNVATTGSYDFTARVAAIAAGGSFHIEMDGVNITGALSVPNTGGWQTWTNVTRTVALAAGQHIMRFYIDQKEFNTNKFTFTTSSSIVSGAIYRVISRNSGKCMEVAGGPTATGQGVYVQQWGYVGATNQQWKVEDVGSGYYKLTAVHSGRVLDVEGVALTDSALFHQWDWLNGANQKFAITDVGSGYVKIVAQHSGKCVDVKGTSLLDGAPIHQWGYLGGLNQQWKLEMVGVPGSASTGPNVFPASRFAISDVSSDVAKKVTVYPNPAGQHVTIDWKSLSATGADIAIVNANGQTVLTQSFKTGTKAQINTSGLSAGLYSVTIRSNKSVVTKKIIIVK